MNQIRIHNTQARFIGLPRVPGRFDRVVLRPGGNNVPADYWEAVKAHPGVVPFLQAGWIKEIPGGEKAPEGPEVPASLEKYKDATARALIDRTDDLPTLERWRAAETRKGVKEALEARIAALAPALPPEA